MRVFPCTTIAEPIEQQGVGIHTGENATVRILPGSEGLRIRRPGEPWTPMTPNAVTSTTRCTAIAGIRTVEHLLSALMGMGVTDADIEVDGAEVPILDGSSLPWVEAVSHVGTVATGSSRTFEFRGEVRVSEEDRTVIVRPGAGKLYAVYERWPFPGRQELSLTFTKETYAKEIAPARTVALGIEVEELLRAGHGRGGTPQNTLVIGSDGYLTPCRFEDEPVRHKLLDCIGDLALAGVPLRFLDVACERAGHTLHVAAARALAENLHWTER